MRRNLCISIFVLIFFVCFSVISFSQQAEPAKKGAKELLFKTVKAPKAYGLFRYSALRALSKTESLAVTASMKKGYAYQTTINKKGKVKCGEEVGTAGFLDVVWLPGSSVGVSPGDGVSGGILFLAGGESDGQKFPQLLSLTYYAIPLDEDGKLAGQAEKLFTVKAPSGKKIGVTDIYVKACGKNPSVGALCSYKILNQLSESSWSVDSYEVYFVEIGADGKPTAKAQRLPVDSIMEYNALQIYRPAWNGNRWLAPILLNHTVKAKAKVVIASVKSKAGSTPPAKPKLYKVYELDTLIDAMTWYEFDEADAVQFLPPEPKKQKTGSANPPAAANLNLLILRDRYRMFTIKRDVKWIVQKIGKRGSKMGVAWEPQYPEEWALYEDYADKGDSFGNNFHKLSQGKLMDDGRVLFAQSRSLLVYPQSVSVQPTGEKLYVHQVDLLALNQKTGKVTTLVSSFPETGQYYDPAVIDIFDSTVWIIQEYSTASWQNEAMMALYGL